MIKYEAKASLASDVLTRVLSGLYQEVFNDVRVLCDDFLRKLICGRSDSRLLISIRALKNYFEILSNS